MKRIAIAALALAACGGQSTATDHNKAGSGSTTMTVTGDINASQTSTGPSTSFSVRLRDGVNSPVTGATVTIHNQQLGDVALTDANNTGVYTSTAASIPSADFGLTVVKGSDNVQGVVVGNPGVHVINGPASSSTVAANQPLTVSWTTPTTAKSATITTNGYSAQAPDTGTYTIPAANNTVRNNQHVDVARFNEVDIAGGFSGSRLRVTYTASFTGITVQ
jgi:hypothetical protein